VDYCIYFQLSTLYFPPFALAQYASSNSIVPVRPCVIEPRPASKTDWVAEPESCQMRAGGSAIMEMLFEGTPHEMVTIYYDVARHKLGLTHYCMLPNRPKMIVQSVKMNEVTFSLIPNSGINAAKDDRMHSLTIDFEGDDTIVQHWTRFNHGKKKEVVELTFNRVK
jgi:hypothetical protein